MDVRRRICGKRSFADLANDHRGDSEPGATDKTTNCLEALKYEQLNKIITSNFYKQVSCLDRRSALQLQHSKRVEELYKESVEFARRRFNSGMVLLWRQQLRDMFPQFLCILGSTLSFLNGFYQFDGENTSNGQDEYPVYRHLGRNCWLYVNQKRQWCISDFEDMYRRASQGWAHSAAVFDGICPMQSAVWRVHEDDGWKPANISISERSSLELVVRSLAGEQLLQAVYDPMASIGEVKSKLGDWKPGKRVRLTFRGRVLGDRMLLGAVGIEAGESLQAICQERNRRRGGVFH